MLKDLLTIFRGDTPLTKITDKFARMLKITEEMVLQASDFYWEGGSREQLEAIYRRDIEVNKLERKVRRLLTTHVTVQGAAAVPYGLMMMSLVKDVERIGDYAKNLVELADLLEPPWPESPLVEELGEIREAVHLMADNAADVFLEADDSKAAVMIQEGKQVSKRCDELVVATARSDLSAAAAVKISQGARFYKRIEGHLLNLLSSVVMPLDKLDYFDEDLLPGSEDDYASDYEEE